MLNSVTGALFAGGIIVLGVLVFVWLVRDHRPSQAPLDPVFLALLLGHRDPTFVRQVTDRLIAMGIFPADLDNRVTGHGSRLDQHDTDLTDHGRRLDGHDSRSDDQDARMDDLQAQITRLTQRHESHTHRFSFFEAIRRVSWWWALVGGVIAAVIWFAINRLVPLGHVDSLHPSTGFVLSNAWHHWGFTWSTTAIAFAVGGLIGLILSYYLRRPETTGPQPAGAQLNTGTPTA